MRVTDEALLRGRSKAPLDQITVLYVDQCGLEAFANLEGCVCLHSLYARRNKLVTIDNLEALPQLWHVDLSENKRLRDLSPLSSCLALGYLGLRGNELTFKDLVPLRDVHIVELHLADNASLVSDGDATAYRLTVAALLPNVWSLDGHFITAAERLRAMDRYDIYVHALIHGDVDGFGATAALWTPPAARTRGGTRGALLLAAVAKAPSHPTQREPHRLRELLQLYDELACLHNGGLALAPTQCNDCEWPRLPLGTLKGLPPRPNLHFLLLLTLPFKFPTVPLTMVADAMIINLLGHVDAVTVRAVLRLPTYVRVALAHQIHQEMAENVAGLLDDERRLWTTLPAVHATLVPPKSRGAVDPLQQRRWCYVVVLLSRAPTFPALSTTTSASSPEYVALKPLLEAAHMRLEDLYPTTDAGNLWMGSSSNQSSLANFHASGSAEDLPWNCKADSVPRNYERPWDLHASASAPNLLTVASTPATELVASVAVCSVKIGEWVEVRRRQYVPIVNISNDNKYVTLAAFKGQDGPPFNGSATLPIAQLLRATHKVWKVMDATTATTPVKDAVTRIYGPLHRVSHAHYKAGLPRSVGVPNFDVSPADALAALERCDDREGATGVATVEGFATNGTWDANYVLAPPQLISVQNYCMAQRDPGLVWSAIEAPAYIDHAQLGNQSVVVQSRPLGPIRHHPVRGTLDLQSNSEDSLLPTEEPVVAEPTPIDEKPPENSLQALRRDLAMLLGRTQAADTGDTVFITSLQEAPPPQPTVCASPTKRPVGLYASASSRSLETLELEGSTGAAPRRKAGHRTWHAVAAKPQLIVGSVLPRPSSQKKQRGPLMALPSLSVTAKAARLAPSASVPHF
ncbi:hypothetical protein ACHHYP_03068 [Achlya hypogyna]|uniref:Uncharacterized protein n=1 Tax=Achlya hypogyna TaxID=1202772 RepID=A0A1V9Z4J2_ACHHY|nr:hypothetical protein ACHHYP_03068 [Achlya hypogyna]